MTRPIPMPADFIQTAPTMTNRQAAVHYGVCRKTIERWWVESGLPARRRDIEMPADFPAKARLMSQRELVAHFGYSLNTIIKWERRCGVVRRPGRNRVECRVVRARTAAIRAPEMAGGRVELAAQFLRRTCAVYRCGEKGGADAKGKFWRVGMAVLTDDELVARAEAKGWRADAWKELGVAA